MNMNNEDDERETIQIGQHEYEIYNLTEDGQNYPRYPFVVHIPYICFSPIQLHAYMVSYFQMIRALELQNMQAYNRDTSIPFCVFCGFCNMSHIIDRPMSPEFVQHMTSGVIIVPQWTPLFLRRPADDNNPRQE